MSVCLKFYKCGSINQLRFLKIMGFRHISKTINPINNRTYWIFEQNVELESALVDYTKQKNEALGRKTTIE